MNKYLSRKFVLAISAVALFQMTGHPTEAVAVVLAYLGANVYAGKNGSE